MSMKLGGFAALLASAFLMLSCEEEQRELEYTLTLIEAPTRLPYDADWPGHVGPYDTIAVRFSVALSPPADEIDTIFCRMLDRDGYEIAEMLLFDDGNEGEYHDVESWQEPHTGDSIRGDFIYSARIIPAEVAPNYTGASYTFVFEARFEGRSYAQTSCGAQTWIPWVRVDSAWYSAPELSLCVDSLVIVLDLARDSLDSIVSVMIGFPPYVSSVHGLYHDHTHACLPISGDTIWRGVIYPPGFDLSDWVNSGLAVQCQNRLGLPLRRPIDISFVVDPISVNTELISDTIALWSTGYCYIPIAIYASICEDSSSSESVDVELWDVLFDPPVTGERWRNPNDGGYFYDETASDAIYTGAVRVLGSDVIQNVHLGMSVFVWVAEDPNDPWNSDILEESYDSVSIVLLPYSE